MKIKIQYVKSNDPYKALYDMSKADLIKIIKDDEFVINRLNKKY